MKREEDEVRSRNISVRSPKETKCAILRGANTFDLI